MFKKSGSGKYNLRYSTEAQSIHSDSKQKSIVQYWRCKSEVDVKARAAAQLKSLGGDPANNIDLLGQYELQFGVFRGKTFKWLVENGLGYAAFVTLSFSKETESSSDLSKNKHAFLSYMRSFSDGRAAMLQKAREKELEKSKKVATTSTNTRSTPTTSSQRSLVVSSASLNHR